MINSEYYHNYKGPNMTSCVLDNKDYTDRAIELYGPANNWEGLMYTYEDFFGAGSEGMKFRFDFKGVDGRSHWFHGWIDDKNQYVNFPLATPMCQRSV